jgi:lysophospholipase L1-like esterase
VTKTRPEGARRLVLGAGGAVLLAALGAAVAVVELFVFRRWGSTPVPGPYELDGTVSGGASGGTTGVGLARWVWLGDSLSSGVGADRAEDAFPRLVAALVAAQVGCDVELVCLAVPGASAADALAGQVPAAVPMLGEGVAAVVVIGCNDVIRCVRPAHFRAAYTRILEALGATGATVIAAGVPDLGSMVLLMPQPLRTIAGWAARRADAIVSDVAAKTGAQYVSLNSGGRPDRERARALLSSDRFHPNGAGYRVWAELVAPRLVALARTPAGP